MQSAELERPGVNHCTCCSPHILHFQLQPCARRDVNLSWKGGDPGGDAVRYDVTFETNDGSPDNVLCANIAETSCDPGKLAYDTRYYWQVVARDVYGATTAGPVWTFKTEREPATPPTSSAECVLADDTQYVLLYDQAGQQHNLLFQRSNNQSWQGYMVDLRYFAGQTVKLYFGVFNNGNGGVTVMYVDDVSLELCP